MDAYQTAARYADPTLRAGSYIGLDASALNIDFAAISEAAPRLAGDLAFRLFCLPRFSEYRSSDHMVLVRRARVHLRGATMRRHETSSGQVATYELLPDGSPRGNVLVVHGWTSEASFMMALAEPLRRSGFRVVLVDCPAHGRSGGEQTTLVSCARAVVEVVDVLGPFDGIVAHSMGALAGLLGGAGAPCLPHGVDFQRYCLIAAPNRFREVTLRFANRIGVSAAARRQFEHQLARIAHMPLHDFCGSRFLSLVRRPTLLIHGRDDMEVPFHNAREMEAVGEFVALETLDGVGHRRILFASPVIRKVVSFMREIGQS